MFKQITAYIFGTLIGCLLFPLTALAADEYEVMGFDGNVTTVTEPVMTQIVDNIIANDGQEIADLYLEAVKTGDYSKFYETTNDTTETGRREKYVTIDGKTQTDAFLTTAQASETWAQTIAGPSYTIPEVGEMIKKAGYEPSNNGAQAYFVDILLKKAKRPDNAEPVYRLSEIDLQTKRMEDIEWFNEGVVVEYEDIPLTTFQREIAAQYGLEVKSAAEVYKDEPVEEEVSTVPDQVPDQVPDAQPVEENPAPVQENQKSLTVKQFVIALIVIIWIGIVAGVVIAKVSAKTKEKRRKK